MARFICDCCKSVDILELTYPNGHIEGCSWLCCTCGDMVNRDFAPPVPYDPARDDGAVDIVNRPSGLGLG